MSHAEEDAAPTAVAFADILIPGDDGFPRPSSLDIGPVLVHRLAQAGKGGVLRDLLAALAAAGGPFADLAPEARRDVAARIEADKPELFEEARKVVYLTYYEQPAALAAIRALGFVYNDTPLPEGYAPEPFDPAADAPRHTRGRWIPTEQVARVDLSGLDHVSRQS